MDIALVLGGGRKIFMESCYFGKTYAGLLDGNPSEQVNSEIVESSAEIAKRIWPDEPVVVLGAGSCKMDAASRRPSVLCAAHFVSYEYAKDDAADGSSLVVVWFQHQSLAICPAEVDSIFDELDWAKFARDFYW